MRKKDIISQKIVLSASKFRKKHYLCHAKMMKKYMLIRLTKQVMTKKMLLALCFIGTMSHAADKKIYVLADIHVMAPSLVDDSSNHLWTDYLSTSKTMQDLSAQIFDALTDKIILDRPDLVLITGDLTKDSEIESHIYVLNNLTKIKRCGIPVFVIPGNHDRGWMERALVYVNDTCRAAEMIDNDGFAERYFDYGYGPDTERYGETLNYVSEPIPGLTLIGIDSGIWVTYREGSIDWVCEKAKYAMAKGNQVIVMVHHPLMPHYYYQNKIFELSVAENYEVVREQLVNAGIKIALTGHSHASDITRYINSAGKEFFDIGTGSPISYPCDYRVLTFDNNFTKLNITTKSLTELSGYKDFPTYAKGRLKESIYNWASKWFRGQLGDSEDYDLIISIMSQALSNAFTLHAIGNESQNPDAEEQIKLYNDILRHLPDLKFAQTGLVEEISYAMKSLLGDYPSEEESDNIVNDRELTIHMPSLADGIMELRSDTDECSPWFTIQGTSLSSRPFLPGIYIHEGRKIVIR